MTINKMFYGCDQNHSFLDGFQKIEKVVEKVCGNIEVYGVCCTCHEQKQKDYCEECLR